MKTVRFHETGDLRIHEEEVAMAGDGEISIRVKSVGVCGSNWHWFAEGSIGDAKLDHLKARQELFHISIDEPVNYAEVAKYLNETRGYPCVEIKTPYHSTWLDNTKAGLLLGWRPEYDLKKMIDSAFDYVHAQNDPRKI